MLTDPRGTGRYQPVTDPRVLAVGPLLSHRFDRLVRMPAGCLGLEACRCDGTYATAGAERGFHLFDDLSRGVLPIDLNEDGHLDIVAPGMTGPHRWLVRQVDGTFRDDATPAFAWPGEVLAVAAADFDNCGHEELLLVFADEIRLHRLPDGRRLDAGALTPPQQTGPFRVHDATVSGRPEVELGGKLYRAAPVGQCLRVAPRTRFDGPAYGATVRLKATVAGVPRQMLRLIDPGTGYGRPHEPVAHFGLGRDATLESVTVTWPDGARRTLTGLHPDTAILVPYG